MVDALVVTIALVVAALAVVASPASATVLVSRGGQGAYEGNVTGTIRNHCPSTPGVCTSAYRSYIVLMPVSVTKVDILPTTGVACMNGQASPYGPVYAYSGEPIKADNVHLTAGRFSWVAGKHYYGGARSIAGKISGGHASGTISVTAGPTRGLTAATSGAHQDYGAHYSWTATWDGSAMPALP